MKKTTLFLSTALAIAICFAVVGNKSSEPTSPSAERREVRETRRANRQAAMERQIDSIVMAKAFTFYPQTMQQEPAGRMQMLSNPNFEIRIMDNAADIFLPYIKGITPPYRHTILNYTISGLDRYISIQTDEGWSVKFRSSLYGAATYTFNFEINAKFGTTTLTLSNTWDNDVTYMGTIRPIY